MTDRSEEKGQKRRRDALATRAAILEAATRRFADEGFERAGVRSIAADAGVTAALVNRYFGSKEGLFEEVVEHAFSLDDILDGDPADLALRLARMMVYGREGTAGQTDTPLLLLVRSATEPRAAEMLRDRLDRRSLHTLAGIIGGHDAAGRAAMVVSQMVGFALVERVIQAEGFVRADPETLVRLLATSIAASLQA